MLPLARQKNISRLVSNNSGQVQENFPHVIFHGIFQMDVLSPHILPL